MSERAAAGSTPEPHVHGDHPFQAGRAASNRSLRAGRDHAAAVGFAIDGEVAAGGSIDRADPAAGVGFGVTRDALQQGFVADSFASNPPGFEALWLAAPSAWERNSS